MGAAALVWAWRVFGLKLLSSAGAWRLGFGGSLLVATLLWPVFAFGYGGLRRIGFGTLQEHDEQVDESAWLAASGTPVLLISGCWSLLVLGSICLLQSFDNLQRGGVLNFLISVLVLHLFAWGATAATQSAWSAWRERV